jgi:hypothetical protein
MVLVGDRRPEQGHDAITHDLVDRALIAMHRRHQALQDRIEELAGLLGVAIRQQLHRALQVRKENRHLLALPFKRSLGLEDLLGEVDRGVAQRFMGARGQKWRG